ncbi:LuxR C-terminal-related transcriptional regulator [uncultured Roseovarius sp.]|uniref:response regulator transcription factor n=1 Tax=uncultured Roseovarius sp. TaxID=293344 RepID=UPI00260A4008|nr:LuxR C-terminal-related transcriptional regulator [uncultured Roseovarius sp.]
MNAALNTTKILELARSFSACPATSANLDECLSDLADFLRFDASMLTSWSPSMESAVPLTSSYSNEVASYLTSTYLVDCPGFALAKTQKHPVGMSDTPFSFYDTVTYGDCLGPAGFREGVTYVIRGAEQKATGVLYLSSGHDRPLSDEGRLILSMLTPSLSKITQQISDSATTTHIVRTAHGTVDSANCLNNVERGILEDEEMLRIAAQLASSNNGQVRFYHITPDRIWWKIVFRQEYSHRGSHVVVEQKPEEPPMELTFRELEVANLTCFGLTNTEIADQLGVTLSTVKTHLEKLYDKLGVSRRSEVPMKVFQHGLYVRQFRISMQHKDWASVV